VTACKCGCGQAIAGSRRYVDNAHKIRHMRSGAAIEMNRRQSVEGKRKGGSVAGRLAAESGQLAAAGLIGAEKARRVAQAVRQEQARTA
jgi:hypothetical protein